MTTDTRTQSVLNPEKPSLRRRLLAMAPAALRFGGLHALAITVLVVAAFLLREIALGQRFVAVVSTFAVGAFLGGSLAWIAAMVIASHRPATARFAAMLVALIAGTSGGIALAVFLAFRFLFVDDPEPFPSLGWLFQFIFTGAFSLYVFLTSGIRLLLPAGVVPLLAAAAWFAWHTRRRG